MLVDNLTRGEKGLNLCLLSDWKHIITKSNLCLTSQKYFKVKSSYEDTIISLRKFFESILHDDIYDEYENVLAEEIRKNCNWAAHCRNHQRFHHTLTNINQLELLAIIEEFFKYHSDNPLIFD